MNRHFLYLLLSASLLCCLYSCDKPGEDDIDIPEEETEVHQYEIIVSAEGLDKVNFLELCVNMKSSCIYEFTIDDGCDWLEVSYVELETGENIPYITVDRNFTVVSRSTEIVIQSSAMSSSLFYEKHLIIQESL